MKKKTTAKTKKPNVKVRDLKPNKDAKGGAAEDFYLKIDTIEGETENTARAPRRRL